MSAEFFRREEDSLPPVMDAHSDAEEVAVVTLPLSPATIARRARLRRVVAGVVAFAGVISLAVVGKTLAASKQPVATIKPPPVMVQQEAKQDPRPPVAPPPVAQKPAEALKPANEPAKIEVDPRANEKAEANTDAKPAEPPPAEAKPAEAKPEEAKPEEAKRSESGADAASLKKETLNLLNRGKNKDAVEKAREAIAADPADALSYLYLGSALQDLGKWKEGVDAYSECVRTATKGPVHECHQMGGHK